MSIVQTNHFKNLTHLSLQLRLATDTSLKRYLASRLFYTKELLNESNTSLADTLVTLKRLESMAESRLQELKTLQCEVEVNLNTLTSKHAIDLAEARAIAQSERADAELSFRRAHEAQVLRHESIAAEAQASEMKIRAELETLQTELSSTRQALQTALSSEANLRDEGVSKTEELQRLREVNITSSLLESKTAKELTQLSTRCAVLEQQVVDQRELLSRSQAQAQQSELLRERLEEDVGIYKALYEKNQDKLERSVKEIEKGNEVITHLDESFRIKADQLKQMQDRLVERERTVLSLQREIDTLRATVERERESREASEAALELSRNHLKQARETVNSNEQVIAWLNKELQEATTTISEKKQQQLRISSQQSSQLSPFINAANAASKRIAVHTAGVPTSANLTITSNLNATAVSSHMPTSSSFFSQSMTNNKSPTITEQLSPPKASSSTSVAGVARENPYLAGTVPLADMLHEMKASGFTLNASTILESKRNSNSSSINNTSSGVPGGGR
jgi:hypothetical protein